MKKGRSKGDTTRHVTHEFTEIFEKIGETVSKQKSYDELKDLHGAKERLSGKMGDGGRQELKSAGREIAAIWLCHSIWPPPQRRLRPRPRPNTILGFSLALVPMAFENLDSSLLNLSV